MLSALRFRSTKTLIKIDPYNLASSNKLLISVCSIVISIKTIKLKKMIEKEVILFKT